MCTCNIVAVGFADCDGLVWQDAIDNMREDTNHIIPVATQLSHSLSMRTIVIPIQMNSTLSKQSLQHA